MLRRSTSRTASAEPRMTACERRRRYWLWHRDRDAGRSRQGLVVAIENVAVAADGIGRDRPQHKTLLVEYTGKTRYGCSRRPTHESSPSKNIKGTAWNSSSVPLTWYHRYNLGWAVDRAEPTQQQQTTWDGPLTEQSLHSSNICPRKGSRSPYAVRSTQIDVEFGSTV